MKRSSKPKQRLRFILMIVSALGLATGLSLYALQDNVAFFFTPTEVHDLQEKQSPLVGSGHVFRLGGMVKKGSIKKRGDDLSIRFVVTDGTRETDVAYTGLLPDLFREGQGVVAKGSLDDKGVFTANELLAKHDENYVPPEMKKAMERQGGQK